MKKTILITGSTDGIGLETAKMLLAKGHKVLLHGRNIKKVKNVEKILLKDASSQNLESFVADLSNMKEVNAFAKVILKKHKKLDVLINNAGVYNVENTVSDEGLDVRFAVNTIAPYLLTKLLSPILDENSRVVNLSSAAQARVEARALMGKMDLSFGEAYAQSKLAITMWSRYMALHMDEYKASIIAVNPKSLLATKMVKEAYGISGSDLSVGANILCKASLDEEFESANGKYFDNDIEEFALPHADALDEKRGKEIVLVMETILRELLN